MTQNNNRGQQQANRNLPTAAAEDVEFSEALADRNDREAARRAAEANKRQTGQSDLSDM